MNAGWGEPSSSAAHGRERDRGRRGLEAVGAPASEGSPHVKIKASRFEPRTQSAGLRHLSQRVPHGAIRPRGTGLDLLGHHSLHSASAIDCTGLHCRGPSWKTDVPFYFL